MLPSGPVRPAFGWGDASEEKHVSPKSSQQAQARAPSISEAFVERQQELSTLSVRLRHEMAVELAERLKYGLELQNYHLLTAEELADRLSTSVTDGLSSAAAAQRLEEQGPNAIPPPSSRPLWLRFLLCFFTGFAPLLWTAAFFVFLSWKPFGAPPTDVYSLVLAIVLIADILLSGIFTFHQVS
eukprot:TRINITY_DN788_c0_g1_i9.p1 TRINITY_DN788_c0_g1~~TRINITY_DN788_c0_g1_i9.p1  ORF type:complete len:207 (+),score=35.61 TRINITY_DN788_c0_g1_i9:71-622(+)